MVSAILIVIGALNVLSGILGMSQGSDSAPIRLGVGVVLVIVALVMHNGKKEEKSK